MAFLVGGIQSTHSVECVLSARSVHTKALPFYSTTAFWIRNGRSFLGFPVFLIVYKNGPVDPSPQGQVRTFAGSRTRA